MKTKQRYEKPTVKVIHYTPTLLNSLSMEVSNSWAYHGGDAKKRVVMDESEDDQWGKVDYNLWK